MWKAMWDALVKKKNTCSIYGMMYNLFTVFTVQNAALKALKSQTHGVNGLAAWNGNTGKTAEEIFVPSLLVVALSW